MFVQCEHVSVQTEDTARVFSGLIASITEAKFPESQVSTVAGEIGDGSLG